MAQLRDIQTSQIIAEGTRYEIALAGKELGYDQVLFDDVGDFDPEDTIASQDEFVVYLTSSIAVEEDPAIVEIMTAEIDLLSTKQEYGMGVLAVEAQLAMDEARTRVS